MYAMRLPTVTLKSVRNGEVRILNTTDYYANLGKYMRGWTRVTESNIGVTQEAVDHHLAEEAGERYRKSKPGHISRGDERRRFEQNTIRLGPGGAAAAALRAAVAEQMIAIDATEKTKT